MKSKSCFKFIKLRFIISLIVFLSATLVAINFYPQKSLFFKTANDPPQLLYFCLQKAEIFTTFLDQNIVFFPSVIRFWWRQSEFIQLILTLPLIFIFAFVLTRVKVKYFLFLTLVFLLFLLPLDYILTNSWDKFVVSRHFDLALPWSKKYIWISGQSRPPSAYTQYRFQWQQKSKTSKAQIRVSCLGHYRVSVNGQRFYHGPKFAVLPQVYYDTLDISDLVRKGSNKIEIICSFIDGVTHEHPQYLQPGLLIGGKIKDGFWFHNLADQRLWQYSFMQSLQGQKRLFNAGWVEKYDLTQAEDLRNAPAKLDLDYLVLPRPIPLLKYKNQEIKLLANGVYDLTQFSTGFLKLEGELEKTCQLALIWGVELDNFGFPLTYMDQADQIRLSPDKINWEQFSRRSGRFLGLKGDCDLSKIRLSFTQVFSDFALPRAPANLKSLDKEIFQLNLNALKNNVQDHFEDSTAREKAMYLGDALAVSQCLLVEDGNEDLVKQAILQFSQRQNPDGSFPSMAPSGSEQMISSYSLQWPVFLNLYLQKTDDADFAKKMWPHLTQWFSWTKNQESPQGFFYNKFAEENWWDFIDWTPIAFKYTYFTPLQLYYFESLKAMAQIAGLLGKDASLYQNKAVQLKDNLYDLAYDQKNCIFYNSFDQSQKHGISLITNAIAGKLNMFPNPETNEKALTYFKKDLLTQTPFSQTWVIDWLLNSGEKELALQTIRSYWGKMIEDGATSVWEVYKPGEIEPNQYQSHSHAWGCGPVYQYYRIY